MIKFNRNHKFVRRVFNNGTWDDGGRYYGGFWQTLPKEWRKRIRIGGSMVAEIDYSGLHIVLLYALAGIDYWKEVERDPYQIDGYEQSERMRNFLKQVLLVAINSKNLAEAVRGVNWEMITDPECPHVWVRNENLKVRDVVEAFAEQHSPIAHHFFSGYGVRLQNIDSVIAEHVINKMTEREMRVLCVHDSFIVASHESENLDSFMQEAFGKVIDTFSERDKPAVAKVKLSGLSKREYTYWSGAGMRGPYGDRDMALRRLGWYDPDYELQTRQMHHEQREWEIDYYKDNGEDQ